MCESWRGSHSLINSGKFSAKANESGECILLSDNKDSMNDCIRAVTHVGIFFACYRKFNTVMRTGKWEHSSILSQQHCNSRTTINHSKLLHVICLQHTHHVTACVFFLRMKSWSLASFRVWWVPVKSSKLIQTATRGTAVSWKIFELRFGLEGVGRYVQQNENISKNQNCTRLWCVHVQGGAILSRWIYENSVLFQNKRVLEVGAGLL